MSDDYAICEGLHFSVPYPFVLEEVTLPPDDPEANQMMTVKSWRPGTRDEFLPPDSTEDVADGIGSQEITVVSVHKPGRFPHRVFYTREWIDPSGKRFGKPGCRVKTLSAFRRLVSGFRYEYRLSTEPDQ